MPTLTKNYNCYCVQNSCFLNLIFSSAFDTIDHNILKHKLSCSFGVRSSVLPKFHSYLSDKNQSLITNDCIFESFFFVQCVARLRACPTFIHSLHETPFYYIFIFLQFFAHLTQNNCNFLHNISSTVNSLLLVIAKGNLNLFSNLVICS